MFYTNYVDQCNKMGLSPSAAAEAMGFQRSVVTRWANGTQPRQATLQRIATFFDCTVEDLLKEKAPIGNDGRIVTDDDIKYALFGGDGDITDAMYEEVKQFAQMVKLREDQKKKG